MKCIQKSCQLLLLLWVAIFISSASYGAEAIVLSVDNPSPPAGSRITFSVAVPSTLDGKIGIFLQCPSLGFSKRIKEPPFSYSLNIQPSASVKISCKAAGFVGNNLVSSDDVLIQLSDSIPPVNSISFQGPPILALTAGGDTLRLRVIGISQNGASIAIPAESLQYSVLPSNGGSSSGLSVSRSGVATGIEPGDYYVSAGYNGLSTSTNIHVRSIPTYLKSGTTTYDPSAPTGSNSGASSSSSTQSGGGAVSPMAAIGLLLAIGALTGIRRQDKKAVVQK